MRICVDLNVWVQDEMASRRGRAGAASRILDAVRRFDWSGKPLQLVMSAKMLDVLGHVLQRESGNADAAALYVEAIADIMRVGPERLDPHLLLAGTEQFAVRDREDREVLATAITAKADLLVTSNLRHFLVPKVEAIVTRTVKVKEGTRELHAQIHRRPAGGALIVADPIDANEWLDEKMEITASAIRSKYRGQPRFTGK